MKRKVVISVIRWFNWQQDYKWARKYLGGKWYLHETGLSMAPVWFDYVITSCQAKVISVEEYHFNPRRMNYGKY